MAVVPQPGDVVFQNTPGQQAMAITAATDSIYTHCGVVMHRGGKPFVLEAVQPVQIIPLAQWKARSPKTFKVMRLKDPSVLTPIAFAKAERWARQNVGKDYDGRFQWSEDRMYCSELVWKVFKHATGVELSPVKRFADFNLEHPRVKKLIVQRYGSLQHFPKHEKVVAPSDLEQSKLLVEVR